MKVNSNNLRHIILIVFFTLALIPLIQNKFTIYNVTPLSGAIDQTEDPYITVKGWLSGDYQLKQEHFLNTSFGFRNLFVRINNQLAFNLFKKAKANGVIIGKENYLFEESYIKAYYGNDFIGEDSISFRMKQLSYIQKELEKRNKTFFLVFAAGKASFYPEFIPDKLKSVRGKNNNDYHINFAKEQGVSFIDFNSYFVQQKSITKYPLYPQYGIHWSSYGMYLAADSIIHYIEKKRNIDIPNFYYDSIRLDKPIGSDYDIADGMNLKFRLKSFKMAYPEIRIQADSGRIKPSMLVISDSYYWGIFNFGFSNAFSLSHFWYYNKQVFPESYQNPLMASRLNILDEIEKHDVIFIMATEANVPKLGWGFIEQAYEALSDRSKIEQAENEFNEKLDGLKKYIRTDQKWMELIRKSAIEKNVDVDSMITLIAIWELKQK